MFFLIGSSLLGGLFMMMYIPYMIKKFALKGPALWTFFLGSIAL